MFVGINDVLGQLGFSGVVNDPVLHHAPFDRHYNHFHIDLRAPQRVDLPQNLLTGDAASNRVADDALIAHAQSLLDQFKADLNLTQGEVTMFIPDMPNVPPQNVPLMIAQANQAQAGDSTKIRAIGVCAPVSNVKESAGENIRVPLTSARGYFQLYEHRTLNGSATTIILQQPKHGVLRLVTQADVGTILPSGGDPVDSAAALYIYLPDSNYSDDDTATIQVDFGGGLKVNVKYYFQVMSHGLSDDWANDYCSEKGVYWKISSILDANGNSTITSVEYQSPNIDARASSTDTAALASTLGSTILSSLSVDPSVVTLTIADLPGGAVGQTVGTNIALDTNAAGNNWYIDTTPADNSEYLPTSNPNEWVAKAGSAAAGKMDMLSVLLHEYGHALGIEHSADNHDYMSTTLTVGVRRLPSATELALMQQLIAQAKNSLAVAPDPFALSLSQGPSWFDKLTTNGPSDAPSPFPALPIGTGLSLAFLGRMRKSSYGSTSIDVVGSPSITQYAVAANAAFTNLNTAAGWNTQGSVDIVASTGSGPSTGSGQSGTGSATLNEVSTSQTRLSQVFMLNDKGRYLSFTLSGAVLDNLTGAPDDAFEVALLDANTGLSVLGNDGLTHTDAFLNLQGDGTEHAASSVTRINNADGSRTYRVDLTGVTKNKAVNLSFDLLGFGVNNSHVTLRDVRVSGLPQLHDEVATIAEDNLLTFNPFAQINAPSDGTTSHSTTPVNGQVAG